MPIAAHSNIGKAFHPGKTITSNSPQITPRAIASMANAPNPCRKRKAKSATNPGPARKSTSTIKQQTPTVISLDDSDDDLDDEEVAKRLEVKQVELEELKKEVEKRRRRRQLARTTAEVEWYKQKLAEDDALLARPSGGGSR